ncbi:hypothetical protein ENBRE01_2413 [Enteropsectra breve]|nr:hypothetical protein ENBRE01_2413 [Enteropsectra breve]
MKKFLEQLFSCTGIAKFENCGNTRLLEDLFRIGVRTEDMVASFDLRDLLKFDYVERAVKALPTQSDDFATANEPLIEMQEAYEDALGSISRSTNDTYKEHVSLLAEKLEENGFSKFLKKPSKLPKYLNVDIPHGHVLVNFICQLTSVWCSELNVQLDDNQVIDILEASADLQINKKKKVDVFINRNGKPQHLHIKVIDLFCINFVYLLKKAGLLSRYRALLKSNNTYFEDKEDKAISAIRNFGNPLLSYIRLLEIEMDDECVSGMFLCSESRYFAYEAHYREKCKVIVFNHKNDIPGPSERLDLITELNSINKIVENRRLDILLPYFDGFVFHTKEVSNKFISNSIVQDSYYYIDFIEILTGLQEVYIYNMLPHYKTLPTAKETEGYLNSLFVTIVNVVLEKLDGLNSLFIQGFNEFPQEFIPRLQKKRLRKFGAMGNCGKVDYLVIHRLFSTECPLKQSIGHFIGHCRAVQLFSQITKKIKLEEATVYNRLYGANYVLSEADELYSEQLKEYFVDGSLNNAVKLNHKLSIGTVYYMRPVAVAMQLSMQASTQHSQHYMLAKATSTVIDPSEFLTGSKFTHLIVQLENAVSSIIRDFVTKAIKEDSTIEMLEIIINGEDWPLLEDLNLGEVKLPNRGLNLILNVDAKTMLYGKKIHRHEKDSTSAIYWLFDELIVNKENNVKLKVKVRRQESSKMEACNAQNKFIELCKNRNSSIDSGNAFSRLSFEEILYDVGDDNALRSIHL